MVNKIHRFFLGGSKKNFKKGVVIIKPEDKLTGVYFLKKGYVRAYVISPDGQEISLHIFVPATFFPMNWALAEQPVRYYFEALTDVECYVVSRNAFLSFLDKNTDVLKDLAARAFIGLDRLTGRIENLSSINALHRLISILMYFNRHFGIKDGTTSFLKYKFSHSIIGSFAGLSRETTTRQWKKLEALNLLAYNSTRRIVFKDIKKLEKMLQLK